MIETLEKWLAFAESHAYLIAVLLGGTCAYVLTLALERYFLPVSTSAEEKRRQKRITFLFCWAVAAGAQSALWWVLAPTDPFSLRVVVNVVTGALVFPLYPAIAAFLTARFPDIGSAWRKVEDA
jgi:hypothetical protein